MTAGSDERTELAAVQQESDPVRQARMAGELLEVYRLRSLALGRLRAEAIERAVRDSDMTYADVAKAIGLTRGRISQICTKHRTPDAGESPRGTYRRDGGAARRAGEEL